MTGDGAASRDPLKILMLFSWTGGGHRAAARALEETLPAERGDVVIDLRDGLVEAGGWPLNRSPQLYSWCMRRARWTYALPWHLTNGPRRARLMTDLGAPFVRGRIRRMVADSGPDVIVSVHPLLTRSVTGALRGTPDPPPTVVVVTDPITPHPTWFEPAADRTLVPTEEARTLALAAGLDPARVAVTGQVVPPALAGFVARREELRAARGWEGTIVLMLAGGDGVGRLDLHLEAVARAGLDARLVVVCGRNESLRADLAAREWKVPVEIHGFVDPLGELMAGADILITKAGPGSLMEGCVAGLPMLLYDHLPGQEIGNVRMVEECGIGHYVPRPQDVVAALRRWLDDPEARVRAAAASRAAAVPDSATRIAREILAIAGPPPS